MKSRTGCGSAIEEAGGSLSVFRRHISATLIAIDVKYLTYHNTIANKFFHLIDGVPTV